MKNDLTGMDMDPATAAFLAKTRPNPIILHAPLNKQRRAELLAKVAEADAAYQKWRSALHEDFPEVLSAEEKMERFNREP